MLFLQLPPVHSPSTARPPDPDIRSRSSVSSLLPCYFCSSRPVHSPSTARPPDPDIFSRSSRNLLNENPSIDDAFGKNNHLKALRHPSSPHDTDGFHSSDLHASFVFTDLFQPIIFCELLHELLSHLGLETTNGSTPPFSDASQLKEYDIFLKVRHPNLHLYLGTGILGAKWKVDYINMLVLEICG